MSQRTVYDCDRCGKPRFAILEVDLERRLDGPDEVTETVKMDSCAECLARALKLAIPLIPMTERRSWYEAFRGR